MSTKGQLTRLAAVPVLETLALAILMVTNFAVIVRIFDPEEIGLWLLVNALLGFSRSADFWSRGLSSFVGEARGRSDPQRACDFVHTAVLSSVFGYLVLAMFAGLLVWAFSGYLIGAAQTETLAGILPYMIASSWLMSVAGVYQAGFLGFDRPSLKAAQTIGGALVFLATISLLKNEWGLMGLVAAHIAQGAYMLAIAIVAFSALAIRNSCRIRGSFDAFRELYRFGAKMLAIGGIQLAIEPLSRLLVAKFGGLADVMLFEMASRLVMQVRGVLVSAGQILVPTFAKLNDAGYAEQASIYVLTRHYTLVFGAPAFAMLIALAQPIGAYWIGNAHTVFPVLVALLALGWLSNTVASTAYFLCMGRRELRPVFVTHAIMTLGTLVLGTLGGLAGGILGVVIGITLSIFASSIYLIRETERKLPVRMQETDTPAGQSYHGFLLANGRPLAVASAGFIALSIIFEPSSGAVEQHAAWAGLFVLTALTCFLGPLSAEARGFLQFMARRGGQK